MKSQKQDLKRDIERNIGAFPSQNQIRNYLHRRKTFVVELMEGIEPMKDGRATRYYAGDVADRIIDRMM